jgi:NAD(P)H-dependent FMN reductase
VTQTHTRPKLAVVLGSTRPGRNGEAVAHWVFEQASKRGDADFELIDLADYNLPLLDEPLPTPFAQYSRDHTKAWSAKMAGFDGYVFVVPEYNHGVSAAMKNALDFIYKEWNNKAASFVSYGKDGGVRSVEHLKLTVVELQMAIVHQQVSFSLLTDFENWTTFRPSGNQEEALTTQLNQLVAWSAALRGVRVG